MDGLLYTVLALITSVGSAALAYAIMDARRQVAVGEERSKSAAAQTEQMRRLLEFVVTKERPGPHSYRELLEAGALLDAYPRLTRMSFTEASVLTLLPPGSFTADAESARGIGVGEARSDVASDDREVSARPRHNFAVRAATPDGLKDGLVPHTGMVRRHFRHRGWRWRPRIR